MKSFLGHAAVYGVATFLMRAAGFVLLPLYLRCLSTPQFGVLEVVTRMAETAGMLLLFGGFRQALFTLYGQAEGDDKRRVVCATYVLITAGAALGAAAAWCSPGFYGVEAWTLRLAVLTVLVEPFSVVPLSLMQARSESLAYVAVVGVQFLCRVAVAVLFVAGFGWGVDGVLLSVVLTGVLFGVALSVNELRRGIAAPAWPTYRALLAFALPLLPGGACFFVLHHGDRFFLLRHADADAVGVYGLGYKLAMLVSTFGLGPAYMVWTARMYAIAKGPDAADRFGEAFTRILAWFLLVGLGMCLFAADIVDLLGGPEYAAAAAVVPPVVLACWFQAAATLMDGGLYVTRRTDRKLAVTALAAALMLVLYAALIPLAGLMGAAVATMVGFAGLAAMTYRASQPLFPVRYEWGRLGAALATAFGLWAASFAFPSFAARCCLMAAAPVLFALLATREERGTLAGVFFDRAPSPGLAKRSPGAGLPSPRGLQNP
ncbi:MAG: lipopolysaccharide biosynthesis protein, partial [Gemmataceae bacterium]